MPKPVKTVYQRSQENGGYLAGPSHRLSKVVASSGARGKKTVLDPVESSANKRQRLQDAITDYCEKHYKAKKGELGPAGAWIEDFDSETVVFQKGSEKLAADYSMKDGKITLGEPVEVAEERRFRFVEA